VDTQSRFRGLNYEGIRLLEINLIHTLRQCIVISTWYWRWSIPRHSTIARSCQPWEGRSLAQFKIAPPRPPVDGVAGRSLWLLGEDVRPSALMFHVRVGLPLNDFLDLESSHLQGVRDLLGAEEQETH
jgi:hypothetical protein